MNHIVDLAVEKARSSFENVSRLLHREEVPVRNERPRTRREDPHFEPAIDLLEGPADFVIVADVPGGEAGSTSVFWDNGVLTIDVHCTIENTTRHWLPGEYFRSIHLPENADGARAKCKIKNGVLTIHVPKLELVAPRLIAVAAA